MNTYQHVTINGNKTAAHLLRNSTDMDKWGAAEFLGISVNTFRALTQKNRNVYVSGPPHDYTVTESTGKQARIWQLETIVDHDRGGGFSANQIPLLNSALQPIDAKKHAVRETAQYGGKTVYLVPAIARLCGAHANTVRQWITTGNYDPIMTPAGRVGQRAHYWTQKQYEEISDLLNSAPYNVRDMRNAANVAHTTFRKWVNDGFAPKPVIAVGRTDYWNHHAYQWARQQNSTVAYSPTTDYSQDES